jgi:hypothetical protein
MGFMDKAKQLAEQAQQKLEETQKQFNEKQAQKGAQGAGQAEGVRYDEHGRPVQDQPPADQTSDVRRQASEEEPAPPPAPAAEEPAPPPAERASEDEGDTNANPDPFKPIQ